MADAKEFLAAYSATLAAEVRGTWPSHWLEAYEFEECLKSSPGKEAYLVKDRRSGAELVLRATEADADERADAEWAILSGLDHPGIPKTYGTYVGDGRSYVAREYFPGEPLDAVVAQKAFTVVGAYQVARQLADILSYLQQQTPPIIHRDIKPQNIIVRPDGSLGLTDFGIARIFKPGNTTDTRNMGTLQYAPPEQFGYAQSTILTDIYALGIVLIYVMTGSPDRQNLAQRITDPKLLALIEKCIAFDPNQRFQSADEIRKWLDKSQPKRKRWLIPAVSAFTALVVLGVSSIFAINALNAPGAGTIDTPNTGTPPSGSMTPPNSIAPPPNANLMPYSPAGNYPGNLILGGFAVASDSELYLATPTSIVALSPEGKFLRKITDSTASSLNFYQGKLYFLSNNDVWSYDPMTDANAVLWQGSAGNLFIDQDSLYYTNQIDENRLYSLSLDGKTTQPADDFNTSYYRNLVEGTEYLCVGISMSDSGCKLTSLEFASGKTKEFGITSSRWVAAWDGWLYYSADDGNTLRRVKLDGSGDESVTVESHDFNIPTERGVFSLNAMTAKVELIDPESGSTSVITDSGVRGFNLAGDWIIYKSDGADLTMIRVDGSGQQPVPSE
ncbi:MAG: protein kinase [Propionibacteriaceae bacterium]|jgi:serine/threonine protein kinase|nr:protein kinase [Propionibacteriaceae bacterium]